MLIPVNIKAVSGTTESITSGFTNVEFSNGYIGYCIDEHKKGTETGHDFQISDTLAADHNPTGTNISQELKVLFTQFFEDVFESDGNGSYKIKNERVNGIF